MSTTISKLALVSLVALGGVSAARPASAAVRWFNGVPSTVSVEGHNVGIIEFGRTLQNNRLGCASIRTRVSVDLGTLAGQQAHRMATTALVAGRTVSVSYDDVDCSVIPNSLRAWFVGLQ